jgi:DNA (cytosine-5)-methyltransferase 1
MAIVQSISGTLSVKWAKGTGGPAGDECQNLVVTQKRFGEYEPGISAIMTGSGSGKTGENLVVAGIDCRNGTENNELSATLQAKPGGGFSYNCTHPVRIGCSVRRLTPLECERLQDYPDGWTDIPGASDSGRYKALGNSVAVCCPEYVLEGIKKVLEGIGRR